MTYLAAILNATYWDYVSRGELHLAEVIPSFIMLMVTTIPFGGSMIAMMLCITILIVYV